MEWSWLTFICNSFYDIDIMCIHLEICTLLWFLLEIIEHTHAHTYAHTHIHAYSLTHSLESGF